MNNLVPYDQFVKQHQQQLLSSAVPEHFWPALCTKLANEIFDAGEVMQILKVEYDDDEEVDETSQAFMLAVKHEDGIKAKNPYAIYLVDHAWTFRVNEARQQLQQHPALLKRLCNMMAVDDADAVLRHMWKYSRSYAIGSGKLAQEECIPIWYILDELGSAITHSDDPNFRITPFLHIDTGLTYSLLFPMRDCEEGALVSCNFVDFLAADAPERAVYLLPWEFTDLSKESFIQTEPGADYFTTGHIAESYPQKVLELPSAKRNEPLKVYAEYDVVQQYLTDPCFELVASEAEADILWLTHHFKTFAEMAEDTPHKFINQFPYEYVITIKDLLCITCRRAAKEHHNAETLETFPRWLPTTYNLKTEVVEFAAYYQCRAAKSLDNHWIVKPWNLARGLDTHISDTITQVVRLAPTGPKIAQKYIENPVLFYRAELDAKVKFDIRYVILLKNVQPLEAYVHRKFFLRFANKPFSLDHFDDYEKHFTVMNYQEEAELRHIKCEDFLKQWQEQHSAYAWSAVEDEICEMLHQVLLCATKKAPPCGIAPCAQSRACYAADIMLEYDEAEPRQQRLQPKLLEINWTPDCKRACDYYPNFFNDIFKLLFLDEVNDESFRQLRAKA